VLCAALVTYRVDDKIPGDKVEHQKEFHMAAGEVWVKAQPPAANPRLLGHANGVRDKRGHEHVKKLILRIS
jgi:hypothetical protein